MIKLEREEFEEYLLRKRVLLLEGEITREKAMDLRRKLLFLSSKSKEEIKIIIDTPGGEVIAALFLYEFISHLDAPVVCIINGECSSSGVVVLQGAKKRFATESSFFYLHPLAVSFEKEPIVIDERAEERVKDKLRGAEERQKIIYNILIKKTNRTLEEIKEKENKVIFAREAKELGLIDEVLPDDYKI